MYLILVMMLLAERLLWAFICLAVRTKYQLIGLSRIDIRVRKDQDLFIFTNRVRKVQIARMTESIVVWNERWDSIGMSVGPQVSEATHSSTV